MMKLRKMQKQIMEAQEKLEQTVFTGTAGGGVVTAEVKGNHEVVAIHIDPEAMDDKDMVEDMVVLAINDAGKKIDAESNKLLGGFGGGLGGFGF